MWAPASDSASTPAGWRSIAAHGGLVEVEHAARPTAPPGRRPAPSSQKASTGVVPRSAAISTTLRSCQRAVRSDPASRRTRRSQLLRQRDDEPALDRRQLGAERGVGEQPAALLAWLRHDRAPERVVVEPEPRHGEVEAQLERPAADLRHHHGAGVLERRRGVEAARSDVAAGTGSPGAAPTTTVFPLVRASSAKNS